MILEVKSDKIHIPHSVWKLIPKFIRSFRSLSSTNQEDVFQSYSFLGQSRFCPPLLLLDEMFAVGMWAPEHSSNRDFEDVNPSFKSAQKKMEIEMPTKENPVIWSKAQE